MTLYEQLRKDSTISWHKLYAEERAKRKEIETKKNIEKKQLPFNFDPGERRLTDYQ